MKPAWTGRPAEVGCNRVDPLKGVGSPVGRRAEGRRNEANAKRWLSEAGEEREMQLAVEELSRQTLRTLDKRGVTPEEYLGARQRQMGLNGLVYCPCGAPERTQSFIPRRGPAKVVLLCRGCTEWAAQPSEKGYTVDGVWYYGHGPRKGIAP